jgi:predicted O-linked N-acetylglucosamine transferase (SPINDLY family)
MPADNAKLESAPDGPADRIPFAAAAENLSATDLVRAVETLRGGGQANTAELLYEAWIDGNPSDPLLFAVLFNYSVALADAGKLGPAKESLVRAIALNGDFVPAFINLGRLCERQGDVRQAVEYWSSVRAKLGQVNGSAVGYKTTALNQSARVLETAGQDQLAEGMLKESLDIDCHQSEVIRHWVALRQRQCKWPVIVPSERTSSRALTVGMSPLSMAIYADDPMRQLAHSYNYNKEEIGFLDSRTPPSVPNRSGPLRIGYLSSDLREHAVGYLLSDVFALHDRNAVAVSAYYCGPPSADSLHLRFKASADHWTDISGLDDVSAARRIAEDGIQILVDLNGYMGLPRFGGRFRYAAFFTECISSNSIGLL